MSFDNLPELDDYAMNEADSHNTFNTIFCERNGFRARRQTPDNGSDYLVELIANNRFTHHHFTVQLKSEVKISVIENGAIISYPFKTSRIRYLLEHKPKAGLIVLYHVTDKKAYFETVSNIYKKLNQIHSGNGWQDQEMVNIHIPKANLLTEDAARKIHVEFTTDFELLEKLLNAYGDRYGLTVVPELQNGQYDLNNPKHIKDVLTKYGMHYLSQNDVDMVDDLLSRLSEKDVEADLQLMLVKASVKALIGLNVDSKNLIDKIRRRFILSKGDEIALQSLELTNSLTLGEITTQQFISGTKALTQLVESADNQTSLRLNTLYFELLSVQNMQAIPAELLTEMLGLDEIINKMEESKTKYDFKLRNAENMGLIFSLHRNQAMSRLLLRQAMNAPLTLKQRIQQVEAILNRHNHFYETLHSIRDYGYKTDNKLLLADCFSMALRFQLEFQTSLLVAEQPNTQPGETHVIEANVQNACWAIDVYVESKLYRRVYNTIAEILEVAYLMEHHYHKPIQVVSLDLLKHNLSAMEKLLEMPANSYKMFMPGLLKSIFNHQGRASYANLSKEQLHFIAMEVLSSGKYPNAQYKYILGELEGYQLFDDRCKDETVQLVVALTPDNMVAYTRPTRYALLKKTSGIFSDYDTNVDRLLTNWGL